MKNIKKFIPVSLKIFILKFQFFLQTFFKFLIYFKNKNYKLSNVKKSFEERLEFNEFDEKLLMRICSSYVKAKKNQLESEKIFFPSNEWLPIYENNFKEVSDALYSHNYVKLHSIYSNFYREDCSEGLVGSYNMKERFFSKKISFFNKMQWVNSCIHAYNTWKSRQSSEIGVDVLNSPNIGNPYGYFFDNKFVSCGLYQQFYSSQIEKILSNSKNKIILELGAGYGGMAYFIIRDVYQAAYIDLDLPENIALTSYYLLKAFPEKNIILFGESENINDCLVPGNILLMPSFVVKDLNSESIGLIYNSYSLAEMGKETIDYYIQEFDRLLKDKGYFYHLNHNSRCAVKADDFGINPDRFTLLHKMEGNWNIYGDEFEYLYIKH